MRASTRALMLAAAVSAWGCAREHAQPLATQAAPAAVSVIAADRRNGRLTPVAAGSGVVVAEDGSVLTSYHILHDERGDRLHDAFIIGRSPASNRPPVHVCTGHPAQSTLDRALDLAVIRCDRDIHEQPLTGGAWSPVTLGRTGGLAPGETLWLLGHSRQGSGILAITSGPLDGWTGRDRRPGTDVLTIRAEIAPGMSGGPAVNRSGALIGVVTGFRLRTRISAIGSFPVGRVALVRPIEHAIPLLEKAGIVVPNRPPDNVLRGATP